MTRSSHIAVRVPANRLEEAVRYYSKLLGAKETKRDGGEVELTGENFFLYIEPGESVVLQEFATKEGESARSKFEAAGCTVFDESEHGFHVTDPFGMSYHIWLEKDRTPQPA